MTGCEKRIVKKTIQIKFKILGLIESISEIGLVKENLFELTNNL
jgi:hypothetical protein